MLEDERTEFVAIHSWADLVSVLIHVVTNVAAIFFNCLLIVLILFKTPKSLRVYSILMLNSAFTDLTACSTALLVMQRMIPSGPSLIYISHGPCGWVSPHTCYVTYCVMLHAYDHSLYSQPLCFGYRYWVLVRKAPKAITVVLLLLLIYSFSFVFLIIYLSAESDSATMRQLLHKKHPDYDLRGCTITGNADNFSFATLYSILCETLPWIPAYALIFYFRRKVYTALRENERCLSESTRDTHKQLVHILTIQSILPAFFALAIIDYAILQFDIYQSHVLEELIFQFMGITPLLWPLVTMWYFAPYRRALGHWWRTIKRCGRSNSVDPNWTSSTDYRSTHQYTSQNQTSSELM